MSYYSDDPVADFHNWDRDRENALAKLPKCKHCGEHIQTDTCYLINDEPVCEDCLDSHYKKDTDSLTEE